MELLFKCKYIYFTKIYKFNKKNLNKNINKGKCEPKEIRRIFIRYWNNTKAYYISKQKYQMLLELNLVVIFLHEKFSIVFSN